MNTELANPLRSTIMGSVIDPKKVNDFAAVTTTATHPLTSTTPFLRTPINRAFSFIYACAILALFYHHALSLISATTSAAIISSLTLIFADLVLTVIWFTMFVHRYRPIKYYYNIENLEKTVDRNDYPKMDVFICTADPYKEPPLGVANTAISVMAYDYPSEKISVYISDDAGSALTLFAFVEAAKFAKHWLPFCRKYNIVDRNPEAYFELDNESWPQEADRLKAMYESMRVRIETVVERGKVGDEYITNEKEGRAFSKWTDNCTRQEHPTFIEILLDCSQDVDTSGLLMPNLVYMSRQKSKTTPHNFKAGALNALLRVSAAMSNAPIILCLDCDMYSNDPETPKMMLCFYFDPQYKPTLGYIQYPQTFRGVNKTDIYACEYYRVMQIHPYGMNGIRGPNHHGSNCFFTRKAFFGGPSSMVIPEIPELSPEHVVDKPIQSESILDLAHRVAVCDYEKGTEWGNKMGIRYGSMVEDLYTGYRIQCDGWRSVSIQPEKRPSFMGDAPMSLPDMLGQNKRWSFGLLQVSLHPQYSPFIYGVKAMGLGGIAIGWVSTWALHSIPVTIYAFLPQLTLLHRTPIFPKVTDPWFRVYLFLFLGAYIQDCLEFLLRGTTFAKWWNNQRMWMLRGLSGNLFGFMDLILTRLGVTSIGFNLTSKVLDDEQRKRYDQGVYEFGVYSPMFLPFSTAAIINLVAFSRGLIDYLAGKPMDGLLIQMFLAGFGAFNSWPIYEAMFFRPDKGRLPTKVTVVSTAMAIALYFAASLLLKI